jgi:hypothetical protein
MFTAHSLCLIICPVHERRRFFKMFKSNFPVAVTLLYYSKRPLNSSSSPVRTESVFIFCLSQSLPVRLKRITNHKIAYLFTCAGKSGYFSQNSVWTSTYDFEQKYSTKTRCSQREYLIMASSKTNRYEYIVVALILQIRCKNCDGLQSETSYCIVGCFSTVTENGNWQQNAKNQVYTWDSVLKNATIRHSLPYLVIFKYYCVFYIKATWNRIT